MFSFGGPLLLFDNNWDSIAKHLAIFFAFPCTVRKGLLDIPQVHLNGHRGPKHQGVGMFQPPGVLVPGTRYWTLCNNKIIITFTVVQGHRPHLLPSHQLANSNMVSSLVNLIKNICFGALPTFFFPTYSFHPFFLYLSCTSDSFPPPLPHRASCCCTLLLFFTTRHYPPLTPIFLSSATSSHC